METHCDSPTAISHAKNPNESVFFLFFFIWASSNGDWSSVLRGSEGMWGGVSGCLRSLARPFGSLPEQSVPLLVRATRGSVENWAKFSRHTSGVVQMSYLHSPAPLQTCRRIRRSPIKDVFPISSPERPIFCFVSSLNTSVKLYVMLRFISTLDSVNIATSAWGAQTHFRW